MNDAPKNLVYLLAIENQNACQEVKFKSGRSNAVLEEMQEMVRLLRDAGHDVKSLEEWVDAKVAASAQAREIEHQAEIAEMREDADTQLRARIRGYLETSNPLFLWDIYSICRLTQRPLPEFLLEYFDRCADNLLSNVTSIPLEQTIAKTGARANEYAGEDCLKAMELHKKNQPNAFAAMRKYQAKYYLILDIERVEAENLTKGMKPQAARTDAIKTVHIAQDKVFGNKAISEGALRKYYAEYKSSPSSS